MKLTDVACRSTRISPLGRLRIFDLADAQIFRTSERMTEHCPHRLPIRCPLAACSFSMLRKRPNRNTAARYPPLAGFSLSHATPSGPRRCAQINRYHRQHCSNAASQRAEVRDVGYGSWPCSLPLLITNWLVSRWGSIIVPACGTSATHSSGISEIQETWCSQSRSAPAGSQRIPLKLILAENTKDAYLIIASRFNSFRSSLVLSISSAAFPIMT
jgi:hypothetical protein